MQLDDNRKIEDIDLVSIENFIKTGGALNKNILSKSGNLLTDNDLKKTTGTQSIEQNSNNITGEARTSSIADREQDINPLQPLKTNNTDIQKDPSPEKDTEGSQDKQNDDSDPKPLVSQQPGDRTGSGGRNNSGSNSRANEENGQNNDKSNLGNNENIKDINSEKENNSRDFDSEYNRIESDSGKDDNNSHTVNDHSDQADTNISAMDSNSWTDIVSKDSDISSQPITSNWIEQVDSNHEADIVK